jgi:type I restriction enzyme S subunit
VVIPADWKELRIGEFCDANWGNTAITKSSYVNSGITAFSASGPDGFVSWHERIGDGIVLSAIGALCGKTWLAEGKWTPIKNTIWMQVQSPDFSTKYLYYATGDPKFWPSRGAAQPFIGLGDVRNLKVQLPPLKEQEAIAEALSDADAAVESLITLIAKKRDAKLGTMQQLLTGRKRLPGFTADWKEVRLGEICDFVQSIALSRSQLEAGHGVGCIHYGDIHTKFNDRLDCSSVQLPIAESGMVAGVPRLKIGDLVIADASEDMNGVGKGVEILGVPEYGVVAGLHTAVLRPHFGIFAKGFLGQLQHMPKFKEQARVLASGLKVYGLSKTSISKISIDVPPLKEQEAIAEALSVIDDELEALTKQVTKLRMVKEGMTKDLLSGKVRLV